WRAIRVSHWVLHIVQNGLYIGFSHSPRQLQPPHPLTLSPEGQVALVVELEAAQRWGTIERAPLGRDDHQWVSNMFVVPKAGGFQPVVDLKPLKQYVCAPRFRMEGLKDLRFLLQRSFSMTKIDLSNAFHSIPIAPRHRRFLQFHWKGELWQVTCMVFGLASAPWVFTKILKPFMVCLHSWGVRLLVYLDNILLMEPSAERLQEQMKVAVHLLTALGFQVNQGKSTLTPTQSIEYLGFVVCARFLTLALPAGKTAMALLKCCKWAQDKAVSQQSLASLLGLLESFCLVVPNARLHCRHHLQFCLLRERRRTPRWEAPVRLSRQALRDLDWWCSNLPSPLLPAQLSLFLETDASLWGWGASLPPRVAQGQWSRVEARCHINYLELFAMLKALQRFKGKVLLRADNKMAVSYVNWQGGTVSRPPLHPSSSDAKDLHLSTVYLQGEQNLTADALSRRVNAMAEAALLDLAFQQIMERWGHPNIDVFAAPGNAKVHHFISCVPTVGAVAADAFSLAWTSLGYLYLFPPLPL
uniref:ribonuclease H n=1 Tax=Latimeria chalumnae TaxID=7897 RepID=H3B8L7_LATCH